jgi:hypothetical protein
MTAFLFARNKCRDVMLMSPNQQPLHSDNTVKSPGELRRRSILIKLKSKRSRIDLISVG